ncbi:hypothetical protein BD830_101234 [Maritimibacter alkaliphilus HTCC2654]|nr:hypothetical protein BD830_101234 [Maritimibacter alkaliphilus HTCC2654]
MRLAVANFACAAPTAQADHRFEGMDIAER